MFVIQRPIYKWEGCTRHVSPSSHRSRQFRDRCFPIDFKSAVVFLSVKIPTQALFVCANAYHDLPPQAHVQQAVGG